MNNQEVGQLIVTVKGWCPAQVFTDPTVQLWAKELETYSLDDAMTAVRRLATMERSVTGRPQYVHLGDVLTILRRARRYEPVGEYTGDPDDIEAYNAHYARGRE